jgi:Pilus formation protein N terminal region
MRKEAVNLDDQPPALNGISKSFACGKRRFTIHVRLSGEIAPLPGVNSLSKGQFFMRQFVLTAFTAFALSSVAFLPSATAGQPLVVEADTSQLVMLPSIPGSIVIGNPTIADATVEGNKLFIHGRSFGTTNLIIMDMQGSQMGAFDVSVSHTTANAVALFRGASRFSFNCAPLCESEFQIGDDGVYSEKIKTQTSSKIELATGTETANSEAPAAPQ